MQRNELWTLLGETVETPMALGVVSTASAHIEEIEGDYYLESKAQGIGLVAGRDRRITSIQLFSPGYQAHQGFTGDLPWGLSFADSRLEVRRKLGQPSAYGGGGAVPVLGRTAHWDRFDSEDQSLHVRYAPDEETIAMVTLMKTEHAKRLVTKS